MTKRSLIFVIVLSIITLGVYSIYWAYVTRSEMLKKGLKIPSVFMPLLPLLGLLLIAFLQLIVRFIITPGDGDNNGLITGINVLSVLIGFISILAIIPLSVYWLYKYSKAVAAVTGNRITFDFCFWIAIACGLFNVPFVWMALVQNAFNEVDNDVSHTPAGPSATTPSPSPV